MTQVDARFVRAEDTEIAAGIDGGGGGFAGAQRGDGGVHRKPFGNAPQIDGQRTSESNSIAGAQNNIVPVAGGAASEMRGQETPARKHRRDGEVERAGGSAGKVEPALQHGEGFVADFHGTEERLRVHAGDLAGMVVNAHQRLDAFDLTEGIVHSASQCVVVKSRRFDLNERAKQGTAAPSLTF